MTVIGWGLYLMDLWVGHCPHSVASRRTIFNIDISGPSYPCERRAVCWGSTFFGVGGCGLWA